MLHKWFICLSISIIISINVFSQSHIYKITGRVKGVSTGKIYLYHGNIKENYFAEDFSDSAKITNGKFSFTRSQKDTNTYGFRIYISGDTQQGSTDLVFIAPKNQYLFIDSISEYIAPSIQNSTNQKEIRNQYNPFFKWLVKRQNELDNYWDSLYFAYNKDIPLNLRDSLELLSKKMLEYGDSLFSIYSAKHTSSLVTLWKLIERFLSQGYKTEYEKIYNSLSKEIKNSSTGLLLQKEIKAASLLAINKYFPPINLQNYNLSYSTFDVKSTPRVITFVDFWFSNCSPCLREFPKYKKLYENYKDYGFSIVGISTDDSYNIESWKQVIDTLKLPWSQYLDKNGIFSSSVLINSFPTNFLLNEKGEIIAKNILPKQLENFLKDRFTKQNINDKLEIQEPY